MAQRMVRREFLRQVGVTTVGSMTVGLWPGPLPGAERRGAEPPAVAAADSNQPPRPDAPWHSEPDLPRLRVPLSFLIDDSTCLVNMGRFCMPQFATAWPMRDAYKKPWQTWPAEIPDSFLREFGTWCAEQGVKGKFSIVPYPACVGWLDRLLPGWSRRDLQHSLQLVRDVFVPHWDIHPEMISHTRVIDIASGRPMAEISPATMENSYPQSKKSVDELASYLAYALQILKNCDLPCQGITTPGGFGNLVKSELSLAVQHAVRDVFQAEIPHYFKYIATDPETTYPRIEHAADLQGDDPRLTVSIVAGTGDWFGSWDGVQQPDADRYCNADATAGRMVELIERRQPAVMLCHWPGMYCNGTQQGFRALQRVVLALNHRFRDDTVWMKASQLARYWAARHVTKIEPYGEGLQLNAPYACPDWTMVVAGDARGEMRRVEFGPPGHAVPLVQVHQRKLLRPGNWYAIKSPAQQTRLAVCVDLPRGQSRLRLAAQGG